MKRNRIARVSGSSRLTQAVERHAATILDRNDSADQVTQNFAQAGKLLDRRVPVGATDAEVDITNMYP